MTDLGLYFVTNRRHEGRDRWHPKRYGCSFSNDGMENLRFGWLELAVPQQDIDACLAADTGFGRGDGERLSALLAKAARQAKITVYAESIDARHSDTSQLGKLGSRAMFRDLAVEARHCNDFVAFVHGFNVTWEGAVGASLALQLMLNREGVGAPNQRAMVVLFTWPCDGLALPFVSYKSDRSEARGSGYALGRSLLKARDFLASLSDRAHGRACGQELHLLCHSMGTYLLQSALERVREYTPGTALPRLFENIFLCAPDVDADALEPGGHLGDLHELARAVTIYHNVGDEALHVSDFTHGNPDRLGTYGATRSAQLPDKVQQVDCTGIVRGLIEHSYYLGGAVCDDILMSIDGYLPDDPARKRVRKIGPGVRWELA